MPLKTGKRNHGGNVKKLMDEYKTSGTIGRTKPKDKKAALAMANAIAYSRDTKRKK